MALDDDARPSWRIPNLPHQPNPGRLYLTKIKALGVIPLGSLFTFYLRWP